MLIPHTPSEGIRFCFGVWNANLLPLEQSVLSISWKSLIMVFHGLKYSYEEFYADWRMGKYVDFVKGHFAMCVFSD